jgi:hypothetical protein
MPCFSQEEHSEKEYTFSIQTSPVMYLEDLISLGLGEEGSDLFMMDLEFQYAINNYFNVSIETSVLIMETDNIRQFTLVPKFLYHPFGTRLKGFYIGAYPNIGWSYHKYTVREYVTTTFYIGDIYEEHTYEQSYAEIGIGLVSGYQWIFRNGFTLSLGGALGKTWSIPAKEYWTNVINSDGRISLPLFDFKIDFKLGYSF